MLIRECVFKFTIITSSDSEPKPEFGDAGGVGISFVSSESKSSSRESSPFLKCKEEFVVASSKKDEYGT